MTHFIERIADGKWLTRGLNWTKYESKAMIFKTPQKAKVWADLHKIKEYIITEHKI